MQKLYTAASIYEAQMVVDLLQFHGISARILNQVLSGLMGEVPLGQSFPQIWLFHPEDRDRAMGVLEDYKRRRRADLAAEIACHACGEPNPGNFELCWSCRSELKPRA